MGHFSGKCIREYLRDTIKAIKSVPNVQSHAFGTFRNSQPNIIHPKRPEEIKDSIRS